MAAALSLDLRKRVIAAIEAGASCRRAAKRFGVGEASEVRWHARSKAEGAMAAMSMDGDRHLHRTEAHAALMLPAPRRTVRPNCTRFGTPCKPTVLR